MPLTDFFKPLMGADLLRVGSTHKYSGVPEHGSYSFFGEAIFFFSNEFIMRIKDKFTENDDGYIFHTVGIQTSIGKFNSSVLEHFIDCNEQGLISAQMNVYAESEGLVASEISSSSVEIACGENEKLIIILNFINGERIFISFNDFHPTIDIDFCSEQTLNELFKFHDLKSGSSIFSVRSD